MNQKTEYFIEKCKSIHGDRYDYSKTTFVSAFTPTLFICKIHGEFETKPTYFLNTTGCKTCWNDRRKTNLTDTTENFIEKLNDKYPNKNYTVVGVYINSQTRIRVQSEFGEHMVTPNHLIRGKTPTIDSSIDKNLYITNKFKSVHKDFYDYSKVEYINSTVPVTIVCPLHGEFNIKPVSHTQGRGCTKCGYESLYNGFGRSDFKRAAEGKQSTLYLIRVFDSTEEFLKVGITTRSIKARFRDGYLPYSYDLVYTESSLYSDYIYNKESYLKNIFKLEKYRPKKTFCGHTECINISALSHIMSKINRL